MPLQYFRCNNKYNNTTGSTQYIYDLKDLQDSERTAAVFMQMHFYFTYTQGNSFGGKCYSMVFWQPIHTKLNALGW